MNFTTNRTVDGAAAISQPTPVPPAFQPQVVRSVRMHPMLAAGVGGFVMLVLLGYGLTRKPSYKAESRIFEEPAAAKLLSDGTSGTFDPTRYDSYLDQQKQIIVRPDVLNAAIASLPAPIWHELGPNEQVAAASLGAQLKADRVKTSYELSISITTTDPAAAAAIVNAVAKAYLQTVHKEASTQTDQRATLLAEERGRIEGELDTTRQEQVRLSAALGVASPVSDSANPYDFEIAAVREQLLNARQAHDVAAAQLNSISGETALTTAADEAILGDPSLASMRATVSARRAALNEQMAGMKPENPVYKQDLDELADLDKTLDTVTQQQRGKAERQLQEKLRTELERTGDVEARMNAQLARLTATATTAAPKLQRASELSADLTRLNTRYAAVDDALRSLQLEANGPGVVRLSNAASVPLTPEPSKRILILAAAPVLGAIFGIAAAVLARKRDRRIYSARDVEEVLGFTPMAVLPAKNDVSARVMDEYVLRLAAGLESAYRGSGAQTFLLTAASAATDIRPLRKALTAKLERIGLDVAVARTTDLLLADPVPSFDEGHHIARPGDGASFVSGHLAQLKGAHAVVVINAPPLGTSAETEYVARCADATILVAESGVTTQEELLESAKLLQRLEAKGVGAVLQELQLRFADDSFRQAIDAVEHRQPEMYSSTVRHRPVAAEPVPVEEPEVDYVAPRERPPVAIQPRPAQEVYPYGWAPGRVEEPVHDVIPEAYAEAAPAELVDTADIEPPAVEHIAETAPAVEASFVSEPIPEPMMAEELSEVPAEPLVVQPTTPLHEKMSPKLSGPRETSTHGDPPMSGSRNWFQRLLHRDDEKVSILPDGDDDDQPHDEASFLTSRISRSAPAYQAPEVSEESKPGAAMGKRFVLEDLHEPQELQPESEGLAVAEEEPAIAEQVVEAPQLVVMPAPPEVSPAVVAPPVPVVFEPPVMAAPEPLAVQTTPVEPPVAKLEDLSVTRLVSRLRPARPLSFHELVALSANQEEAALPVEAITPQPAAPEVVAYVEAAPEPIVAEAEAEPEMIHAVELPQELSVTPEEPSLSGPVQDVLPVEVRAAEPVPEEPAAQPAAEPVVEAAAPEILPQAEPVMEEPVAATVAQAEVHAEAEAPKTEPEAPEEEKPGEITKEFARLSAVNGANRWDPIPPLRPTDSGWNRVHPINGGNGNGHGSKTPEYSGVERRRSEDWSWTSRENEPASPIDPGAQRWAQQAASAELDEPALSRPWGLLSRFQQTHLITPARRNGHGTSNGNGSNGNGAVSEADDHDRELEPGSFRPNRNG